MTRVPVVPSRRALVALWLTAALTFGLMLAMDRINREPGDDPDPAWQRPGLLDLGTLPVVAPPLDGVDPSKPSVVFFHAGASAGLCHRLSTSSVSDEATIAIVTDDPTEVACAAATVNLVDDGALARRFRLRSPAGGGYPTGYAVVDRNGLIRYATLDPHVADELDEVKTMVRALR